MQIKEKRSDLEVMVLYANNLTTNERCYLMHVIYQMDDSYQMSQPMKEMAGELGVSLRTAQVLTKKLEEKGLIEVTRRRNNVRGYGYNEIRLLPERVIDFLAK